MGLPRTQSGYYSIWVIVDWLTKVTHFIPIKSTYSRPQLCNTLAIPGLAVVTLLPAPLDHRLAPQTNPTLFYTHLSSHVRTREDFLFYHPSWNCSGLSTLNTGFFSVGLPKKKVYLGGMSILSIILSLESGCHHPLPLEDYIDTLVEQQRNKPTPQAIDRGQRTPLEEVFIIEVHLISAF
jgi:hypothetical protein